MTAETLIVTLSRVITSCGGTGRVTIRRSTLIMRVTNGGTRKMPGPFAPCRRPSTKITPRSYCCTIRTAERKSNSKMTTIATITIRAIPIKSSFRTPWNTGEMNLYLNHTWVLRAGLNPLQRQCAVRFRDQPSYRDYPIQRPNLLPHNSPDHQAQAASAQLLLLQSCLQYRW